MPFRTPRQNSALDREDELTGRLHLPHVKGVYFEGRQRAGSFNRSNTAIQSEHIELHTPMVDTLLQPNTRAKPLKHSGGLLAAEQP
jgi:hypothetical protein